MNKEKRDMLFNQAKDWVLEAGRNIRHKIKDPLHIDTKSNANDLVTAMDKETEEFFADHIKGKYPDHSILSEEGFGDDLNSLEGVVWIIDPIDGTMNFVHQKKNFAISLAIYEDGIGEIGLIYDVMSDVLYQAKHGEGAYKNDIPLTPLDKDKKFEEVVFGLNHFWLCENRLVGEKYMQQFVKDVRGTRTYGSAALEFAFVAEGVLDGYLSMNLAPWDVAAGMVIVKETGGVTTNIDGNQLSLLDKDSVLTVNPSIQERLLDSYIKVGRK
ncbi:inositol monophosphatase family protein [Virgibacillus xinjiangensis]|uniref:inositol-phosphate phosphatase n=1 Tax=Virgibacillus xinjiangensis TaxID=393090 RepID=A0ABV7CV96_9BACI